jgi:hypothetical protein
LGSRVYGNWSLLQQAVEIRPAFCGKCIFRIEAEADFALPIWFFSVADPAGRRVKDAVSCSGVSKAGH